MVLKTSHWHLGSIVASHQVSDSKAQQQDYWVSIFSKGSWGIRVIKRIISLNWAQIRYTAGCDMYLTSPSIGVKCEQKRSILANSSMWIASIIGSRHIINTLLHTNCRHRNFDTVYYTSVLNFQAIETQSVGENLLMLYGSSLAVVPSEISTGRNLGVDRELDRKKAEK